MSPVILFLSVFIAVSYGQFVIHKVDTLLQTDGLFPGHSVLHVKGQAKQTVDRFSTKIGNPQVINAAYNKYKTSFKKQTPPSEDDARKEEFEKSVKRVMEHNLHVADGAETYGKAINKFSDMDFQEFVTKFAGVRYPEGNSTRHRSVSTGSESSSKIQTGPSSFDWRNRNMITPVKDQGCCGSSVLFATTGLAESVYAINNGGQFVSLSEQELIDCPSNVGGCNGNNYETILSYVQQAGLAAETAYPYQAKSSGSCQQFTDIASIQGNLKIASGAVSIAQTIACTSPVAVDFRVNQDFKDYDGKSIFNSKDPNCPNLSGGHAVLAVGYAIDRNTPYWILKNSWGSDWGRSGFFKFARGSNLCLIENDPWIVTGVGPSSRGGGGGGGGSTTTSTTPVTTTSTTPVTPVTTTSTTPVTPVTTTSTTPVTPVTSTSTTPVTPVTTTTPPIPASSTTPPTPSSSTTPPITPTPTTSPIPVSSTTPPGPVTSTTSEIPASSTSPPTTSAPYYYTSSPSGSGQTTS